MRPTRDATRITIRFPRQGAATIKQLATEHDRSIKSAVVHAVRNTMPVSDVRELDSHVRDGAQDLQREAAPDARPGAGAGRRALAVPHALQHRAGAAPHRLATVPRLGHALSAGSGAEGDPRRVPGVRRPPQPRAAGRAGPAGHDVSGVLSPRRERRAAGVPALPGAHPLALLHLQGVRQRRSAGQRLPRPVEDWPYRRALVPPD